MVAVFTEEDLEKFVLELTTDLLNRYEEEVSIDRKPMTFQETTEYLQVSESTLRRLISEKGLPYSLLITEKRFYRKEINDWLRKQK